MIGVFGGTFDPVHFGHLRPALEVREQLAIDDFRLLPAGRPPHRTGTVSAARFRLDMLRLATRGLPGFSIDERELQRPGPSYMVDTLSDIRLESGDLPIALIVGQDNAASLDSWHRWTRLFELAHVVVMRRPGQPMAFKGPVQEQFSRRVARDVEQLHTQPAGLVWHVQVTQLDIASSAIRSLVRAESSPRFLMPDKVIEYMEENGLYR